MNCVKLKQTVRKLRWLANFEAFRPQEIAEIVAPRGQVAAHAEFSHGLQEFRTDDTTVGVAEGLNAGAWAVGVAVSGNCFGLSLADAKALASEDFARRRARAYDVLHGAGAHYVVDSVADLMPVVALIEGRLARSERP